MTIPNLAACAKEKGIDLIGTGDATQPDWLRHLEGALASRDDQLIYDDVSFVPTVEIEDRDSVHHVIILPDFEAVHLLRSAISCSSPNMNHEWGGRPRVNISAEELAGSVRDVGGLIGPAHAFTPFRSIFREGKYSTLEDAYRSEAAHVHFLELGLSADSEIADNIPGLRRLTYITSSDAHSPSPDRLGREFVVFEMRIPSFTELRKALLRLGGRRSSLNVGLDPQLGKYYLSFCPKCRRTLVIEDGNSAPSFDHMNIYVRCRDAWERLRLIQDIHKRVVRCPSDGRPLRLGVRDRATLLGEGVSKSPEHRPNYLHMPPLLDILRVALAVESKTSKLVRGTYRLLLETFGPEVEIMTKSPIDQIRSVDDRIGSIIELYRNGSVKYIPGGGGRYGQIVTPWED
jgi:PHP family Zn ribbon phosphoesterase